MRAYELDEDFAKILVPVGYAAINAAALALRLTGHSGDLPEPTQAQSYSTEPKGVTAPLPDVIELPKKQEPKIKPTNDAKLLALTMWGEARQDGVDGMRAVGHVVVNRMKSPRFGDGVDDVVWKRKAFSCWNKGDPNRTKMKDIARLPKNSPDYKRWVAAKKIAKVILQGRDKDLTSGAIFYHTKSIKPVWADGVKPVAQVANHLFYKVDAKA